MIASSIFAGVSLTVRHQWHYILSLLWWCPAGRCSDSHDWHCLFCGTDPAPVSKETKKRNYSGEEKKPYPLIGCLNVNSIL